MIKLVLKKWNGPFFFAKFDLETGSKERTLFGQKKYDGYYQYLGSRYVLLYVRNDAILLRLGAREYKLSYEESVENVKLNRDERKFSISSQGSIVVSFKYRRISRNLFNRLDVTYDHFDEENDDMLLFLSSVWRDKAWRNMMFQKFSKK